MKRAVLFVCAILLTHAVMAAEPVDHPLVGRYPNSSIQHQEVSNFGQYRILISEEETETVQGEVWKTLYRAPGDSSTFSVYSTYLDFLETEGFTIFVSYEPGRGGTIVADAYHRAPFANDNNMNWSAPITNGTWSAACYLSAKRESGGSTIYVSVAIAAGWHDFPQYKLDVVEVASNTASIVSVGTPSEEPAGEPDTAAPTSDAVAEPAIATAAPGGGLFSGTGSVRAQTGLAAFVFANPDFTGGQAIHTNGGVSVVTLGGFNNLFGAYASVSWYLNENLGITADYAWVGMEADTTLDDIRIKLDGELMFIRGGAVVRVVGDSFPATIGLGFGGGVCLSTMYQSWSTDTDGEYFVAEDLNPVIHWSAELTFPLVSIGRVSAGFEYLFVPVGDLIFEQDGPAADYSIEYRETNLGGFVLRFGLVAEM